jgi:hypothetical protein
LAACRQPPPRGVDAVEKLPETFAGQVSMVRVLWRVWFANRRRVETTTPPRPRFG